MNKAWKNLIWSDSGDSIKYYINKCLDRFHLVFLFDEDLSVQDEMNIFVLLKW